MSRLIATPRDRLYTAITAVIVVLAVVLGFLIFGGSGNSHTIYAQFQDAGFLVKGNTVHVNGVTEGKIEGLKVDSQNNTAIVKMSIQKAAWPLHVDATARVRPVTLLGEQYVDLSTGSPSKPTMANGGMIKEAQTSTATNLQSVLDAVTDPTSTALGTTLTALGYGAAGEGANAKDVIQALAPALSNTSGLLKLLNGQNALLNTMIDNVTPTLASLDTNHGQTLNGLLTTTNNLLGATAVSSKNIGTDLQELPGTLHAATNTFNQLGNLSDQATPALASITPLTDNLPAVSQELENFSNAADPAVSSLQPLLAKARGLVTAAQPVVKTLQAAGPNGLSDATNLKEILQPNVADLHNLFSFIAEWASTTGDYDGSSHYFRFHADGDTCVLPVAQSLGGCTEQTVGQNAAQPAAKPAASTAAKPATAKATPAAANRQAPINSLLQGPGSLIQGLVGGLLGQGGTSSAGAGSATGLTQNQEQNLLGYLLGGL